MKYLLKLGAGRRYRRCRSSSRRRCPPQRTGRTASPSSISRRGDRQFAAPSRPPTSRSPRPTRRRSTRPSTQRAAAAPAAGQTLRHQCDGQLDQAEQAAAQAPAAATRSSRSRQLDQQLRAAADPIDPLRAGLCRGADRRADWRLPFSRPPARRTSQLVIGPGHRCVYAPKRRCQTRPYSTALNTLVPERAARSAGRTGSRARLRAASSRFSRSHAWPPCSSSRPPAAGGRRTGSTGR